MFLEAGEFSISIFIKQFSVKVIRCVCVRLEYYTFYWNFDDKTANNSKAFANNITSVFNMMVLQSQSPECNPKYINNRNSRHSAPVSGDTYKKQQLDLQIPRLPE